MLWEFESAVLAANTEVYGLLYDRFEAQQDSLERISCSILPSCILCKHIQLSWENLKRNRHGAWYEHRVSKFSASGSSNVRLGNGNKGL